MRKFFKALGLVALLSLPWVAPVNAAVVTSSQSGAMFDAVAEVSDTLNAAPFARLTIFVNGTYAVGNVVWLQEEVGSLGSGAWKNRVQVSGTGATVADATATFYWDVGPSQTGYRLMMTVTGTGAVAAVLTDASPTPEYSTYRGDRVTYIDYFEDFYADELLMAEASTAGEGLWLSLGDDGGSSDTIASIIDTDIEGTVDLIAGDGNDDDQTVALSLTTVSHQGSLISAGNTYLTVRLSTANITDNIVFAGLMDLEVNASTDSVHPFDIDSNVVSDIANAAYANGAGFQVQDAADDTDTWHAVSINAAGIGNNADEFELRDGEAVVVDDYYVVHLKIDATGDCYFYIDDILVYAEDLCVATTAILGPFVAVGVDNAGTSDNPTITVDYIEFAFPRPAAQ